MTMTQRGTSTGERPTQGTTDPDERLAWITLACVPGLGARRIAALTRHFGSAQATLTARHADLLEVEGFTPRSARLVRSAARQSATPLLDRVAAAGQQLLVPGDPAYPPLLRAIPDPPPLLFCLGRTALLQQPAVAIIGSRNHSRYGERVAAGTARAAVNAGLAVVSGLARGLDAVAQTATLAVGGTTVAVLGTGVDVVYPRQNQRLYDRVVADGLLVSEHPPGQQATRGAFPRRNRIISGLSRAVVVVEAAAGSGTLLTVAAALEQGREVMAVPGPIDSPTSRGTNRLLRDGATPLLDPGELPALLGLVDATPSSEDAPVPGLSPEEARVYGALSHEETHLDAIALKVGLPVGTLLGALLGLELGGLVEQAPGGLFRRN